MSDDRDPALEALPAAYAEWRQSTLGKITDALETRVLRDRLGPVRGRCILDVGCGDAVLATALAADGARVIGLDAAPAMLAAGRQRAAAAGVEIDLVEGEAARLPFADGAFDAVVSVATLCFSADPAAPLAEMARVLRPGGHLVLGELGRWSVWAAQRRVQGWLGSPVWRAAQFRSAGELRALARRADLVAAPAQGCIFYPPVGAAARLMAPLDPVLGRLTSAGAAFLVLRADKPASAT